jgi:exportin-7
LVSRSNSFPRSSAQLKFVLDNSQSSLAQTYAALCLVKLVQHHWNSYSVQTRVDIRNYVLNLLAERGPTLARDLRLQLLTLLAKITKLGWFDGEEQGPDSPGNVHQRTVDQVTSFFRPDSPHHSLIGLEILLRLLEEIGTQSPTVGLTEHRRISIDFRDSVLLKVFKLSLTTLRAVDSGNISDAEKPFAVHITQSGLRLAMLCLSYDFVGTSPTESTEDHNVLKIPNNWKSLFDEGDGVALLDLFWNLFNKSTNADNRCKAMEIIVELSSVRRSLFSDDEQRNRHLASLMNGITDVLLAWQDNKALLEDAATLHEFCRLLARLKGNFQLAQIVNAEGYSDWIRLVGQFSLLQDWSEHANSHHYVMSLWARLVAAFPYLAGGRRRGATTAVLEQYAPKVLETFVNVRLAAVQERVFDDPSGDPLLDEDGAELSDLEALPALGRIKYLRTAQALEQQLAAPSASYQQLRLQPQHSAELAVAEGQLSLLVLVIAGIVGGRSGTSSTNTDAHNEIDAALTARVLKIMQAHDQALDRHGAGQPLAASTKRLELSLLAFLQEFRKVYIGDTSLGTTRMFEKLQELVEVGDSNTMLALMMRKIVLDLRYWAGETAVVDAATQLFHELVCGYATIRLVVKLDATNAILANHSSDTFPFLDYAANERCRVLFYTTLSKLLYMKSDGSGGDSTDADATPERLFAAFMAPFAARLELLQQQSDAAALRSDTARDLLVGLLLDLRGVVFGIYSRKAYERFFDWVYPAYVPVFHTAAAVWADTPEVLVELLKFWHEFVNNRSTRIQFDCASANGILLFKETSKLVVAVAGGLRQIPPPSAADTDLWQHKYKAVTHLLDALCVALQGNYCNFGVFKLYDDPALTDAIAVGLDAALSLPTDHILHYTKLTLVYFQTIDRVLAHHIEYACLLPREQFAKLLHTLEQGLTFSEVSVSTQCCNALDALATYADKYRQGAPERAPEPWHRLVAHVQALRADFTQTFRTLLHYALFDNCPNQWSCSRPLFSLTLILPDALTSCSQALIAKQTDANRPKLEQLFVGLLNNCGQNLAFKNRELFTQNFNNFRTEVSKFVTTEAVI